MIYPTHQYVSSPAQKTPAATTLLTRPSAPATSGLLISSLVLTLSLACSDDDPEPVQPDAGTSDPDAGSSEPDGSSVDVDAAPESLVDIVAEFAPAANELPEGLALGDGFAYVGLAFSGQILKVDLADGSREPFGQVLLPPPVNNMPAGTVTGMAVDAAGNIYAALDISTPAPGSPIPGIYRISAAGGNAELFASDKAMIFPNGLYIDGDILYVTDSIAGAVFAVALEDGSVTQWAQSNELLPLPDNCGPAAVRLGANGIVKLNDAFYVANTDRAQIVRIPADPRTGQAGTPERFLGPDCDSLFGLDDIRATAGGDLVYAVNYKNRVDRVTQDGVVETLAQGAPLDGPASIEVLEGAPRRLVVTNSAFGSFFSQMNPAPSLVTITVE